MNDALFDFYFDRFKTYEKVKNEKKLHFSILYMLVIFPERFF